MPQPDRPVARRRPRRRTGEGSFPSDGTDLHQFGSGEASGADDSTSSHGADDDDDAKPSAGSRALRSAVEWMVVIGGALLVAVVIRTFVFTTFWIPSASMEPTLMGEGRRDRVVVNRLSYKAHDVNRGDIVVFANPPGEPSIAVGGRAVKELIKRVVALEGETVELRDGRVYVDGKRLDESYLPDGTRTEPICNQTRFEVPEDSVFVMGDNRANSRDARCFAAHSIEESSIVGRAFVRIWPLSEIGGL